MNKEQINNLFQKTPVNIIDNPLLRVPQIEGYKAAKEHFSRSNEHAIIQIPVGCGKTGLMSILPFCLAKGRVLIIAPNLEIRDGVSNALNITDKKCFWRKFDILKDYSNGPFRAILDSEANIHDCNRAHFVITNIHQLASSADRWLPRFEDGFFDLILVDEAHHNVANSWQRVFDRFPEAKIISLTATPFRSDGRELEGEVIYSYPFSQAMREGYIKQLRVADAQPAEIWFEFQGDKHHHTLEEVLEMREESWFRNGVALSRPTNETIVNSSLELLDRLRVGGCYHQIVAAACTMNHARQIASIYRERDYKADVILSDMQPDQRKDVLKLLKSNQLDCIVQVGILGEGFDWPQLSVAAIFRPFKSLSPYVQFVGRIMRVLEQNDPYHPDNEGWVVSHIGLQQDERWNDFQHFDDGDKKLFQEIVHSIDPGPRELNSLERKRITPSMHVIKEIIDRLVTRNFLTSTDEGAVDVILAEMQRTFGISPQELGLSRDELAGRLLQARRRLQIQPQSRPVQPQDRRRELRRRLDESVRTVASHILDVFNLAPNGVDLIRCMPELASATNNLGAAIRLMHRQVNEGMGIPQNFRGELDITALETAISRLDEFGDVVESRVRGRLQKDQNV